MSELKEDTSKQELTARVDKAFVGKTVSSVDSSAANLWTFYFTDGTSVIVDTERHFCGIYGPTIY